MKKIIIFLSAFLLISVVGFSQQITADKVPAAVKDAFAKKYPAATDVKYEMAKTDFVVAFKDKEVGMYANFNSRGEWLQTETIVLESDVPKEVLTSVATNFVGFIITAVTKLEGPNDVLNYILDLKKGSEIIEVKFSPKGDVLKKTPVGK